MIADRVLIKCRLRWHAIHWTNGSCDLPRKFMTLQKKKGTFPLSTRSRQLGTPVNLKNPPIFIHFLVSAGAFLWPSWVGTISQPLHRLHLVWRKRCEGHSRHGISRRWIKHRKFEVDMDGVEYQKPHLWVAVISGLLYCTCSHQHCCNVSSRH